MARLLEALENRETTERVAKGTVAHLLHLVDGRRKTVLQWAGRIDEAVKRLNAADEGLK